jgi:hypothetical protein
MINPDDYDVFYFSRSDLSDELKLEILGLKIEQARKQIAAGEFYTADEVRASISQLHKENLEERRYKRAS